MTNFANEIIQHQNKGTPTTLDAPLWGPVLLGTIAGCGGLFLPFDRGLSALKNGAPHNLQVYMYFLNDLSPQSMPVSIT